MSLSVSALPPGFSWLREDYRPSDQEVDAYAHVIANAEGYPSVTSDTRLHDEAELQLWIWRAENLSRTAKTRRNARPIKRGASSLSNPN